MAYHDIRLGDEKTPGGDCLLCHNTPVEDDGSIKPRIWAAGMDVNWGEDFILCVNCVGIMADLLGRPDEVHVEAQEQELRQAEAARDKAQKTLERRNEQLKKVVGGSRARKSVKKELA